MKILNLFLLFIATNSFAQLSTADYEKQMKLTSGSDQKASLANLEILEKKMPADAKVIFLRGFYQFRDGDFNGALANISKAIKVDPKFAYAFGARAQLFSTKGMLDKAIIDISEAIKLEPKNLDFLSKRAGFYNSNNQFAEGLEDLKIKIKLGTNNIMDYFDSANFSKSINANANADVFFEQAYANKSISKYLTDVLFGKFLLRHGRFDEAKIKYEAALANNEKDFLDEDFHDYAIVCYKLNDFDKAIRYFDKAIAINPNNVEYRNNLCSVYLDQKNWQKVKETAELSIKSGTKSPMAHMLYAIGLKYTGFESLALEYEKKAKELEAEQNK